MPNLTKQAGRWMHARLATHPITDGLDRAFDIVVETGLGRAEMFAPADRLWLDADRLAAARETPPGWDLRPVFALGALFYPGRG